MYKIDDGFFGLRKWLDSFPDQVDGDPCSVSNIGEPYIEFLALHLARPGDEGVAEQCVADDMKRQLARYFGHPDPKSGTIYWRVRLETETVEHHVIMRVDPEGPDVDETTMQRCFKDRNWRCVRVYCRLVRARVRTMEKRDVATAA